METLNEIACNLNWMKVKLDSNILNGISIQFQFNNWIN
jgi:hypothetical protein